jgi:hypothetical protein
LLVSSTAISPTLAGAHRRRSRWATLGFAGFLFFLFKGLVWLALAAALWTAG